jgi:ribosomal protein S18 acetylase RimI-like enzyme
MAVDPSWHRRGVGSALVAAIETHLGAEGIRLLHVKTLGASDPDPGYARTRAFYQSVGFLPLEETRDLWPGTPCLIMVKPLSARSQHQTNEQRGGRSGSAGRDYFHATDCSGWIRR